MRANRATVVAGALLGALSVTVATLTMTGGGLPDRGTTEAGRDPAATAAVDGLTRGPAPDRGRAATSSSPPAAPVDARLVVTSVDPLEFRPGEQVTLRGTATAGAGPAVEAVVEVHRTVQRFDTRSEVDQWVGPAGGAERPDLVPLATVALGPVPAGQSVPFEVVVPADGLRLRRTLAAAGPYGLVVELRDTADPSGPALATRRGFAVWSPPILEDPLLVAPVIRLPSLEPDPATGLVPSDTLESAASEGGQLRTAAEAAAVLPGTWVVDPLVTASVTAALDAGTAGPETRSWWEDLKRAAADREVAGELRGSPDLDMLAASGHSAELLDLLALTTPAGAEPGGRDATPVAMVTSDVSAGGLALAARAGRPVVVPDSAVPLVDLALSFTPDLRADVTSAAGTAELLITDSVLSARLSGGVRGDALSATGLLADLAATALQRPSDQRVVGMLAADLADADADATAAVADVLAKTTWARPIGLAQWRDVPTAPQSRRAPPPMEPDPAAAAAAEDLLASLALVQSFEGVLGGRENRAADHRRRAAAAVAAGPTAMATAAARARDATTTWVQGVQIIPGSTVTLAAAEAALPVTLVNDLNESASLVLHARSRSPRLRIPEPTVSVQVPAGGRLRVDLPVEAVSDGPAEVTLRLLTPDDTPWGPAADTEVRVATRAEAGVLWVAAAAAAVVFVMGTWRTVRRSRRSRHEGDQR
ncbi:MAG: DUF6049 family protein [Kineosporiaceae bacterium]